MIMLCLYILLAVAVVDSTAALWCTLRTQRNDSAAYAPLARHSMSALERVREWGPDLGMLGTMIGMLSAVATVATTGDPSSLLADVGFQFQSTLVGLVVAMASKPGSALWSTYLARVTDTLVVATEVSHGP